MKEGQQGAAGIKRAARGSGQPLAVFVAEQQPLRIARQYEAVGRGREPSR